MILVRTCINMWVRDCFWVACNDSTSIDPTFERKTWSGEGVGRFHSSRGYSELLGTILQQKKVQKHLFFLMFFEVPSWYQFSGTTSLAAKCQKSHVFFDILEQNVHQTSIFIEWIESRLLPAGGRGGVTSGPWVFALWGRKIAILAERCAIFRCLPGLPWRRLPIYIG